MLRKEHKVDDELKIIDVIRISETVNRPDVLVISKEELSNSYNKMFLDKFVTEANLEIVYRKVAGGKVIREVI